MPEGSAAFAGSVPSSTSHAKQRKIPIPEAKARLPGFKRFCPRPVAIGVLCPIPVAWPCLMGAQAERRRVVEYGTDFGGVRKTPVIMAMGAQLHGALPCGVEVSPQRGRAGHVHGPASGGRDSSVARPIQHAR